ncbi:MAG: capsule assembly Wzi family protein [bacterium]
MAAAGSDSGGGFYFPFDPSLFSRSFGLVLVTVWLLFGVPVSAAGVAGEDAASTAAVPTAGVLMDVDSRTVPWPTIRRLQLEAGEFPPPYRALTRAELATWLPTLDNHLTNGTGSLTLRGLCHLADFGDVWQGEAGLAAPPGGSVGIESALCLGHGRWWLAVTPRLFGSLFTGDTSPPSGFDFSNWPEASGRFMTQRARDRAESWEVDWPQAVVGVQLGNWAVTVGQSASQIGPGESGGLLLASSGAVIPAVTARRTRPFAWYGLARHVAPSHMLLRVGLLSSRDIVYRDISFTHQRQDRPWLFQWLLTFPHTRWLRTTVTSSALALPRDGTLWPDLLQVNFPLLGATESETDRGPLTDRFISFQFEARYRNAPWPILPAAAGRLYWEYAGEDFLPDSRFGVLPQISAPASVAGWELVSPGWDVVFEFAELEHPNVLWYEHDTFTGGYTHRNWLVGHPLGGTGRSYSGWVCWRPAWLGCEAEWHLSHHRWGARGYTPGNAERITRALCLRQPTAASRWELRVEWISEKYWPYWTSEGAEASGTVYPQEEWVRVLGSCQLPALDF